MPGAVMHVQVPSLFTFTVYFVPLWKSKPFHKATVGQMILNSGIYVSRDNASNQCDHFEIFKFYLWTGKWIHNPSTHTHFEFRLTFKSFVFQNAQCTMHIDWLNLQNYFLHWASYEVLLIYFMWFRYLHQSFCYAALLWC